MGTLALLGVLRQESEEDEEDGASRSGSEGTSSEPRDELTDASSAETVGGRARRTATLRKAEAAAAGGQEAPDARRRSTRQRLGKHRAPKDDDEDAQVRDGEIWGIGRNGPKSLVTE